MTILRQDMVDYLRKSLVLEDPDVETDPAYVFTDDDLQEILTTILNANFPDYNLLTIPVETENIFFMLGRKEVYWRLATSAAPYYPLSVEGISIQKNIRFDHYMAMVNQVQKEYNEYVGSGGAGASYINQLTTDRNVGEITIPSRHFTQRNYNLFEPQTPAVTVDRVTSSLAEITWTKCTRGLFYRYIVYLDTSPMMDAYTGEAISDSYKVAEYTDIHTLKHRFSNLVSGTKYYFAVAIQDQNALIGCYESNFTTL